MAASAATETMQQQMNQMFLNFIDGAPMTICIRDAEGRYTLLNRLHAIELRCKKEEALGKTLAEILQGKNDDEVKETQEKDQWVLNYHLPLTTEDTMVMGNEQAFYMSHRFPLFDEMGETIAVALIKVDVTEFKILQKTTEAHLREAKKHTDAAQKEVVDAAHRAGMAEIATGILHNVGNFMTLVNVAANVGAETLEKSKLGSLGKANAMMQEHLQELGTFLTQDPKGQKLPKFYLDLEKILEKEQNQLKESFGKILKSADVINNVISTQQKYAKSEGVSEEVDLMVIIQDTLDLQEGSFTHHHVDIIKNFGTIPMVEAQRPKLIHILTNLFKNAKEALEVNPAGERKITLATGMTTEGLVYLQVEDNGPGVSNEHLNKIFTHGFTTKKTGHGFGLHTCANYMTEMGGRLSVQRDRLGKGALFTLKFKPGKTTEKVKKEWKEVIWDEEDKDASTATRPDEQAR